MLYFDADDIDRILKGIKTSARILFEYGDISDAISHGAFGGGIYTFLAVYRKGQIIFERGKSVGISTGPDTPEVAQILIRGIDRDNLHFDDENSGIRRDLPSEGFADLEEFITYWDARHPPGKQWANDPRVWVIYFQLIEVPDK